MAYEPTLGHRGVAPTKVAPPTFGLDLQVKGSIGGLVRRPRFGLGIRTLSQPAHTE